MLGSEWLLSLVFVVMFYGAGKHEARFGGHDHSLLWAALSIGVSALAVLALHWKPPALLAAQVALFVAIGIVRAARDGKR